MLPMPKKDIKSDIYELKKSFGKTLNLNLGFGLKSKILLCLFFMGGTFVILENCQFLF